MTIRQFVRNHLKLKNLVSNLELLVKVILNKSVLVDYEYDALEYYATVHVAYGHIPSPLIWGFVANRLRFVQNANSHRECVSCNCSYLPYIHNQNECFEHWNTYADHLSNCHDCHCYNLPNAIEALEEDEDLDLDDLEELEEEDEE